MYTLRQTLIKMWDVYSWKMLVLNKQNIVWQLKPFSCSFYVNIYCFYAQTISQCFLKVSLHSKFTKCGFVWVWPKCIWYSVYGVCFTGRLGNYSLRALTSMFLLVITPAQGSVHNRPIYFHGNVVLYQPNHYAWSLVHVKMSEQSEQ